MSGLSQARSERQPGDDHGLPGQQSPDGGLRVVVVDDHPVARHGVATILDQAADLRVVATVGRPGDLPLRDGKVDADVLVVDLYLSEDRPCFEDIAALSEQAPVVVMSASRDPADVLAAMQAGASGYLTKHTAEDTYAIAVRTAADGGFYMS